MVEFKGWLSPEAWLKDEGLQRQGAGGNELSLFAHDPLRKSPG